MLGDDDLGGDDGESLLSWLQVRSGSVLNFGP